MNRIIAAILAALCVIGLAACTSKPIDISATTAPEPSASYLPALTTANETLTGWTLTPIPIPTPEPAPEPWTAEDIAAIVRTLAGECYDDKPVDKRLVCEVILNRVCNGYWGDTVITVITAKGQFYGYWYGATLTARWINCGRRPSCAGAWAKPSTCPAKRSKRRKSNRRTTAKARSGRA